MEFKDLGEQWGTGLDNRETSGIPVAQELSRELAGKGTMVKVGGTEENKAFENKDNTVSNIQRAFHRNMNMDIRLFLNKDGEKTTGTDDLKEHSP